jgi:hypothetical protein
MRQSNRRVSNGRTQVLNRPLMPDSKEQLGGFHIIDGADLGAAIAREAALYGAVEVRPVG